MSNSQGLYDDYEDLLVEKRPDGVVIATLNRPERLNALNEAMRHSIRKFIHDVGADPTARAVVLTGAGRGFCSGADVSGDSGGTWPTTVTEPTYAWCIDLMQLPK